MQEISIEQSISYVYIPFISYPTPIKISQFYDTCTKNFELMGVSGLIENTTSSTIYSVTLTLTLFNHITNDYDSFDIMPALEATFSNDANPFKWSSPPFQYSCFSSESKIEVKSWSFYSPFEFLPLDVSSVEIERQFTEIYVTGEIRNNQEVEILGVNVILIPKCGGYQIATVDDTILSPRERTRFSGIIYVGLYSPPATCEGVDVVSQGYFIP